MTATLVERIWARDATVWTGTDEEKWLGWLDQPSRMREDVDLLMQFADSVVDRIDESSFSAWAARPSLRR